MSACSRTIISSSCALGVSLNVNKPQPTCARRYEPVLTSTHHGNCSVSQHSSCTHCGENCIGHVFRHERHGHNAHQEKQVHEQCDTCDRRKSTCARHSQPVRREKAAAGPAGATVLSANTCACSRADLSHCLRPCFTQPHALGRSKCVTFLAAFVTCIRCVGVTWTTSYAMICIYR